MVIALCWFEVAGGGAGPDSRSLMMAPFSRGRVAEVGAGHSLMVKSIFELLRCLFLVFGFCFVMPVAVKSEWVLVLVVIYPRLENIQSSPLSLLQQCSALLVCIQPWI